MTWAVHQAEQALAARTGRAHAVLTGNGTTALWAVLRALDLPAGAPVLYPDLTCGSAVNAAIVASLAPVFADVRLATAMPTPADLAAAATATGASALVPTHLFGRCGPLAADLARCPQIVDAAQGAVDARAAAGGLAAIVSFGPAMQLDLGGGGAVLTDDASLARDCRLLLCTLAGSFDLAVAGPDLPTRLLAGLAGQPARTARRHARACRLADALGRVPGVRLLERGSRDVPWRLAFTVPATARDAVLHALAALGCAPSRLFAPAHRLVGAFDCDFPRASALADALVNLDPDRLGDDPAAALRAAAAVATALADPVRKEEHAGT